MAPKKQQTKMNLGDFLTDQSLGSWADEMDDQPLPTSGFGSRAGGGASSGFGGGDRGFGASRSGGGFGGGFDSGARSGPREALPLPTRPPYTAHLGNLSFEVTEGDVQDFLSGCDVTSVRIVEDKMDRRPKGFGYVEFGTLDGLKKALELSETQFQGRNIRISVADPPKDREGGRELNDWTRKGPLPDLPGSQQQRSRGLGMERGGSFRGGFDATSDAGSDRGAPRNRSGFFAEQGDGKVRDFGNWERKGPLSPAERPDRPAGGSMRGRGGDGAPRERRLSPNWGEGRAEGTGSGSGRSEAGSRPPRREFQDRPAPERVPTAAEMDNQWRSKMRPDAPSPAPTPDISTPSSPAAAAPPASRPRLNLAKRTVSEAQPNPEAAASSDSKASPFGAARPIDTSAREKEIEEKRQLAIRERKEQEEKNREEKRARDAAAKAEKVTSPTAEKPAKEVQPKANGKDSNDDKESAPAAPKAQYEILRREENGEEEEVDGDAVDGNNANGDIIGDKSTLPQEIVQEVPAKKTGGDSWRKPADSAAATTEQPQTTAESMEDDGWSTVPSKQKNTSRRGGNRAMAS